MPDLMQPVRIKRRWIAAAWIASVWKLRFLTGAARAARIALWGASRVLRYELIHPER